MDYAAAAPKGDFLMTRYHKLIAILWGVVILIVGCSNVGETYYLRDGERLGADSQLVVVKAELEHGSLVEGDLNITASEVVINNHIQGDVTIVASAVEIEDQAVIEGDVIYCLVTNGSFSLDKEATVWGTIRDSCDGTPATVSIGAPDRFRWLFRLGINTLFSLVVGLLAALGTIIFPKRMDAIQTNARQRPLQSLGLGILTMLTALGLSSLWGITLVAIVPIVLAPFIIWGWLVIGGLSILGFVSISQAFGGWLVRHLPIKEQLPVVSTTLGAGILMFLVLLCRVIPGLAFLTIGIMLILMAWSLGAVLLARANPRIETVQQPP
jgi:hypothetical protein